MKQENSSPAAEAIEAASPERVNCGTPPDHIWVHPWREVLYYAPSEQPDYIEYARVRPAPEQARLKDEPQTHLEVIRERVADDYRTIPQPDHGAMLADLKVLLAEVDRLLLIEDYTKHLMARHEALAQRAAAPPPEQARLAAEKAAEKIDELLVPLKEYAKTPTVSTIAAIILQAGVAPNPIAPSTALCKHCGLGIYNSAIGWFHSDTGDGLCASTLSSAAPQGDFRAACVEKVKAMRDEWMTKADECKADLNGWRIYTARYNAADEIITALESPTAQRRHLLQDEGED